MFKIKHWNCISVGINTRSIGLAVELSLNHSRTRKVRGMDLEITFGCVFIVFRGTQWKE